MTDVSEKEGNYRSLGSGELADSMDLGEFFQALGPVMRLPPKDDESARRRSWGWTGEARRRSVTLAGAAAALIAGTVAGPSLLRALGSDVPLPIGLHGRWITTSERYAGRAFHLSEATLRLGRGPEGFAAYEITGVRQRDSSAGKLYTIRYRDGESDLEFPIFVGADSVIHVRNLGDVPWTKAPDK